MSDSDTNDTLFITLFRQLPRTEKKSQKAIVGILSKIYEEYLKSRDIKKYRDKINIFDERIVEMIKTGQINAAIDIREKLQAIAKMPAKKGEKVMEALVDGSKSFDECYEIAEVSGVNVAWYRLLYSFRIKIAVPEAKRMIKKLDKAQQDKCIYELSYSRLV